MIEDLVIPIADAGPPFTITCNDPTVVLDGSNSETGSNIQYIWSTVDGNILSGENSTNPTVDLPGQYVLEVINTDNNCESSALVDVSENIVIPTAVAGPDLVLGCASPTLLLDGSNSSAGSQIIYSWNTTDGNVLAGADGLNPEIDEEGTYVLTVLDTGKRLFFRG